MKATELMIGDWCKMKLSSGTTWFTDKVGCISPDNGMEYEPIPLTPEILEKNGFEKKGIKLIAREGVYYIDVVDCGTEFKVIDENIIIHFVHELQHALRLCGLDELADNFKV